MAARCRLLEPPSRNAVLLTVGITGFFAFCDFTAPGGIIVAIFYSASVTAAGWTRSRVFLWVTTAVCLFLTFAGLAFGPQPTDPVLAQLYINRSFIAIVLILISAIVQRRMQMLTRIEEAHNLQRRQNEMLREQDIVLHRVNHELEGRVEREVQRRLEVEQALHQSQKMEAIGQLTGGVAHDFNNFLTTIIGNLKLIAARSPEDDPRLRLVESALRSAEQGARFIRQLLSFARRGQLDPKVVAIHEVLGGAITLACRVVDATVELSIELDDDLWRCCVDEAQLQSAVLNLVINARDAMPEGGRVVIGGHNILVAENAPDLRGGEYVHITVQDTGTGMPPDVVRRAFEPFFTTKGVGKGSGLGLSMVYSFAQQSGGAARIDSKPGRGTVVHLYLPRTMAAPVTQPTPQPPIPVRERPTTILIVEDEQDLRELAVEALEGFGYRALQAADAPTAITLLEHNAVDLLFSDIVLPGGMSGLDLAKEAQRRYRHLPALLTTGYAQAVDRLAAQSQEFKLLPKPFRLNDLGATVHQMLSMN